MSDANVEQIGSCHGCVFWGDGINEGDNDTARWRPCKADGLKYWAHRDHGCAVYKPAQTLRKAIRDAGKQSGGML